MTFIGYFYKHEQTSYKSKKNGLFVIKIDSDISGKTRSLWPCPTRTQKLIDYCAEQKHGVLVSSEIATSSDSEMVEDGVDAVSASRLAEEPPQDAREGMLGKNGLNPSLSLTVWSILTFTGVRVCMFIPNSDGTDIYKYRESDYKYSSRVDT